nr:MAG TPA: hypothetical protein [Caudoviricetes sp.]
MLLYNSTASLPLVCSYGNTTDMVGVCLPTLLSSIVDYLLLGTKKSTR